MNIFEDSLGWRVKVTLDLSNYASKNRFKTCNRSWHIIFCQKSWFSSFKSDVDKLDTDKLKNVPSGLSNLKSKVDKLDVDKLVAFPVDVNKWCKQKWCC